VVVSSLVDLSWSSILSVALGAVLLAYLLASLALFVFGANLTWFSLLSWRNRNRQVEAPPPPAEWPVVTVQLPIYNELYVARRVIEAACRLDYPCHKLQIHVLDDSDDETSDVVAAAVAKGREAGIDMHHLRRDNRTGFKAGALSASLAEARGSLLAVFDADFVPPADFLIRTVPHFADDSVGFVQARWGHLNSDYSWLTRLQVPAIDGHFLVEQRARGLRGHWFNFNGTAGVWRAAAIHEAGGWHHDTLTEDLDLSYRAHLRGWRGVYLPDVVVPGELPPQLSGFRRQQHRWARGSLECARKLLGSVWRSPVPTATKLQASFHLLAYGVHLLLLGVVIAYPAIILAVSRFELADAWRPLGYLLAPASLAPAVFLISGQAVQLGRDRRATARRLPAIAGLIVFGSGLMINTARAALSIATSPDPVFERTAKFGLEVGDGAALSPAPIPDRAETAVGAVRSWRTRRYQSSLDRIVFFEAVLGLYALATAVFAVRHTMWGVAVFAALFGTGLLSVATASLGQAVGLWRARRRWSAQGSGPKADRAKPGPVDTPDPIGPGSAPPPRQETPVAEHQA